MLSELQTRLLPALLKRHGGHDDEVPECKTGNDYDGKDALRIASIFLIFASSFIGTFFPIISSRYSKIRLPNWCFFFAKYFGSGVIIATGFIHLLEPASDYFSEPCLEGVVPDYPWAFGICLMSLFAVFFVEVNTHFFVRKASSHDEEESSDGKSIKEGDSVISRSRQETGMKGVIPGQNHYSHDSYHQDPEQANTLAADANKEKYTNQLIALFILEFGVVFHSVLIGLSLAVTASSEFTTLFVVLIFHQMFEGLGLGARISEASWSKSKRLAPWSLALGYSLSTPLAIAIGLAVRRSFAPESKTALIVNGVFDSLSAGILIYTGLVELMAHEFIFSNAFRGGNGYSRLLSAFGFMSLGAGLMALLGKWA